VEPKEEQEEKQEERQEEKTEAMKIDWFCFNNVF